MISTGHPGGIRRSRPGDNLRYQMINIFDDNCYCEFSSHSQNVTPIFDNLFKNSNTPFYYKLYTMGGFILLSQIKVQVL